MDFTKIALNPEAHGFKWVTEMVHRFISGDPRNKVEVGNIPLVVVTNIEAFDETFPGVAIASLDGQSVRVKCQNRNRPLVEKGITDLDTLKVGTLQSLAGVKVKVTVGQMSDAAIKAEFERRFGDKLSPEELK